MIIFDIDISLKANYIITSIGFDSYYLPLQKLNNIAMIYNNLTFFLLLKVLRRLFIISMVKIDNRASQFFQIAMQIRGIVVGVKWVSCSQILLAQAYFWSFPCHLKGF